MQDNAPRKDDLRVTACGSFASFDEMCWRVPGRRLSDLDDRLRYGTPTRTDLINAASVIAAYQALIAKPRRPRDRIIARIREAWAMADNAPAAREGEKPNG